MALAVIAAALVGLAAAASAIAAPVLVLSRDGHVHAINDPFVAASATPMPMAPPPRAHAASAKRAMRHITVTSALTRLWKAGEISATEYRSDIGTLDSALGTAARLHGTPAAELDAVIANLHSFAVRGLLGPSRLPALFLTLARNSQWWATGQVPSTYQRVQFAGSEITWEYYPGQGLELQELANFATASALCNGGPKHYAACAELLSEMIPLAANRAGGMTWEYYFAFDGGVPPWTSAMSQGTALQALGDAYRVLHNPWYETIGTRAMAAFSVQPPRGVAVPTSLGTRYVQYTFAPSRGDEVINAFLQSLIGLDTYAQATGSTLAEQLFAAGSAEAEAELPHYDTGAWSLYQPGIEDDLSYHELVTGFAQKLCGMTNAPVYCITARHFQSYLTTPPVLTLLSGHLRRRRPGSIYFRLSKVSDVGITVLRGTSTVFLTSASFPYGTHSFAIPPLRKGTYTVRLAATDLAGNHDAITGTVRVS